MERIEELKISIREILGKGGFVPKDFVSSGDKLEEKIAVLGSGDIGRVLGVSYDPAEDELAISVKINISKKSKGGRTEPDLTYEQIPVVLIRLLSQMELCRRLLLAIVKSCYDVYGLLAPLIIPLNIALRNLHSKELSLGWDTPIPSGLKTGWIKMLQTLKEAEKLRFRRCVKPKDAVGEPELMMSNDGSKDAMCATAHLRWELTSGEYKCVLYCAKTRVTPLKRMSIPRIEMQSLIISVRLSSAIQHPARYKI